MKSLCNQTTIRLTSNNKTQHEDIQLFIKSPPSRRSIRIDVEGFLYFRNSGRNSAQCLLRSQRSTMLCILHWARLRSWHWLFSPSALQMLASSAPHHIRLNHQPRLCHSARALQSNLYDRPIQLLARSIHLLNHHRQPALLRQRRTRLSASSRQPLATPS